MARASADVHTLLINPPSPALTNPDLILPFDGILGLPVSPPRKQPPSPPDSDPTPGTWNNHGMQLNYSMPMPMRSSPALGYGTPLSIIDELETTPSIYSSHHGSDAVRSTPTLKNSSSLRLDPGWDPKHGRRWSNGSGSVHSDDIENMHWPDFEGPSEVDDESVVLGDEEEQLGDLPRIADPEDLSTDEQYVSSHVDNLEDDPLSRRADMILANAKKRLHVMEGNLRGARNSLMLSAPSSPNSSSFSHDKERPRYSTSAGIYGHKSGATSHISTQYTQNFGHNRMLSDSSSAHGIQTARTLSIPKRSSSALGSFARGLSSLEKSATLRGVRSQQDMRDSRLQSWIEESSMPPEQPRPVTAEPPHSRSQSGETVQRPGSAASSRSLRFQMDELKGRINTLKAKAHEERSRRLSSMSSRTPSPFVAKENWYNDAESVKSQPTASDSGLGWSSGPSQELPSLHRKKSGSNSDEDSRSSRSRTTAERTPPKYAESTYEDAEETLDKIKEEPEDSDEPSTPSTGVLRGFEQKVLMGPQDPTEEELGYNVDEILNGQHNSSFDDVEDYDRESSPDAASLDGQSEYFDSVPVMAERHEDRADAFDYENFFLHSAMGSYTRDRRDSVGSESSVETTRPSTPKRPATALKSVVEASSPPRAVPTGYGTLVEDTPGLHRRSQSVDSISTVATFQTATEGAGSDGEDEGEDPLDVVTQRMLSPAFQAPQAPLSNARSNGVHHHMEQHELAAAFLSSILGIEANGSKDVPPQDVALVEGVLDSLQAVVTNLRAQPRDYDRREWRRRLDAAKRALDQLE